MQNQAPPPPQGVYPMGPQFVMMPVPERNGLGVFAFFVALIGIFIPTGIVALLGLILGLAAIGRAPRGMATMAVMLGLLGTLGWAAIMIVAVVVAIVGTGAALVGTAGAFVMVQPEVVEISGDMARMTMAVQEYLDEHDDVPDSLVGLSLSVATMTDPWGGTYRLVTGAEGDDELGFDIESGGPDRAFGTDDDVRLTRLDDLWEDALETFEEKAELLGERMERLHGHHGRFECEGAPWEFSLDDGPKEIFRLHPRELADLGEALEAAGVELEAEVHEHEDDVRPPLDAEYEARARALEAEIEALQAEMKALEQARSKGGGESD